MERLGYFRITNLSAAVGIDDEILDGAYISVAKARELIAAAPPSRELQDENKRLVLKVQKLEQEQNEMLAAMRKLSGIVSIWL